MATTGISDLTKQKMTQYFIAYLIISITAAVSHYLCYVPPFGQTVSRLLVPTAYYKAIKLTRAASDFNEITLVCVAALCLISVVWKRKNIWYLAATISTILLVMYLDDEAFYLPN